MQTTPQHVVRCCAWWLLPLLAFLFVAACSLDDATPKSEGNAAKDDARYLTILHFNDFHGHLLPFKRYYNDTELSGGFARMAYLIKQIRQENSRLGHATLLVSAGDNFQGTPLSTAYSGLAEIDAFNAVKLDATALGNHEFDYGDQSLYNVVNNARFPILSANTYYLVGSDLVFEPYTIIKRKGLKIGILGLTTPETSITTDPTHVADLRFTRPELAIQHFIDELQARSDIIIVLSHLGIEQDTRIAGMFPQLDVIVGGHTHTLLSRPLVSNNTVVVQAGENGLYLGRIDLRIADRQVEVLSQQLIPIGPHLPEDKDIKEIIDSYNTRLTAEISREVGRGDILMDGERMHIRTRETNLGDLIADLMRMRTDTDVAFINSGAIRASIHPGKIRLEDIISAFPMNNKIITMEMSGKDIYLVLKRSVEGRNDGLHSHAWGGFLQVSGVSFKSYGDEIRDIRIGDEPLRLYKTYKVVALDFLVAGGDGYREIKVAENHYNTGVTLQDIFLDYLKRHPLISPQVDGRMDIR